MTRWIWLLAALLVVGCSRDAPRESPKPPAKPCVRHTQCGIGLWCIDGACQPKEPAAAGQSVASAEQMLAAGDEASVDPNDPGSRLLGVWEADKSALLEAEEYRNAAPQTKEQMLAMMAGADVRLVFTADKVVSIVGQGADEVRDEASWVLVRQEKGNYVLKTIDRNGVEENMWLTVTGDRLYYHMSSGMFALRRQGAKRRR